MVEREQQHGDKIGEKPALLPNRTEHHAAEQAFLHQRRHEHRHGKKKCEVKPQLVDFDVRYFKGKDVCVFDDVVTTGKSYANFANMLEDNGANVVGGMFLGKTFYKYNQN